MTLFGEDIETAVLLARLWENDPNGCGELKGTGCARILSEDILYMHRKSLLASWRSGRAQFCAHREQTKILEQEGPTVY